jgi:cytochrome c oxidase subunit II
MTKSARTFQKWPALAGAALATAVARAAEAFPRNELGLPYDASADGHHVDELIKSTGVLIGLLFVAMCVWLVYACVFHNEKQEAKYDHGNSKRAVRTTLGIAAAIFLVVDGNLFINSEIDLNKIFWNFGDVDQKADTVRIEINAHQWAWDARYAGPDGKFNTQDDIVTLNDIRVPVGRPIYLQIASTDVIHSFYLPNFRVKQDAVPGMINRLWFHPKETGTFEVGCAQHCGVNHYKMRAELTVLSTEDYARWASEASARGARGYDPKDAEAHWGWEWKARD